MYFKITQSKFRDVKLFVWLIPAINCINYYLTYSHFNNFSRVLITFTIDTLMGYIAWLLTRAIILWLDRTVSFDQNPIKRIAIQLVSTLFVGMTTIILLTEFVNKLATNHPVPASFYTKDILIISIWFFVVNGIYIGLHYYQEWQLAEETLKKNTQIQIDGFKVNTPKKELLFSFEEIGGFYVEGDYSVIVTTEWKKYLLDFSLDKVEKKIPTVSFFRLNRQFIVHRQLVTGFEKGENGKINVLLKEVEYLPNSIPVSRTKAPEFKMWFSNN